MTETTNLQLYRDVLALSSGTIATLTGVTDYDSIDLIHADIAQLARHACRGDLKRLLPVEPTWMDIALLHPAVRSHQGLTFPIRSTK